MQTSRVEVSQGWIEGSRSAAGVHGFLGIPFAAPPVEEARFAPPRPAQAWRATGQVRGAFEYAASAPQRGVAGALGEMIGIAPGRQSEDCLYLNVWTPELGGARRPVMVWVHGGGNLVGSAAQPRMLGERLAQRGDVVVVSLNYRLGALGFLYAPELGACGNQALLDQVQALRWVRAEIGAFGGDAENITVFGQSAGAFDIAELLALPLARGCFDKAILMSGSLRPRVSREQALFTAQALASGFGGIAKLREVPLDALLDRQAELARNPMGGRHRFAPTFDGEVISSDVEAGLNEAARSGPIPLLIGTTQHEFRLFTAFDPRARLANRAELRRRIEQRFQLDPDAVLEAYSGADGDDREIWNALLTDEGFRMPAIRLAEIYGEHGADVYMYRFDRPSPARGGELGACHSIDVPFVFGTHALESLRELLGSEPEVASISDRWMDVLCAFARSGTPRTRSLPPWPRYTDEQRAVMSVNTEFRVLEDPGRSERLLWAAHAARAESTWAR